MKISSFLVAITSAIVGAGVALALQARPIPQTSQAIPQTSQAPKTVIGRYDEIKSGMTVSEVDAILGKGEGDTLTEVDYGKGKIKTLSRTYGNALTTGAITVTFQTKPNGSDFRMENKLRVGGERH